MKIPKSYIIATVITAFTLIGMIIANAGIAIPLLCLVLAPLAIKNYTWKLRLYFISLSVFLLIAIFLYYSLIHVLLSMNDVSEFEGQNGEGSPIAPLVGMFMATIWYIIPWTVASIRGFRLYRSMKKAEQAATSNR